MSTTEPFVTVLSPQGVVVSQFGVSGQGPTEFELPTGLDISGDSVFIWEQGRGGVSASHLPGGESKPRRTLANVAGRVSRDALINHLGRPGIFRRIGDGWVFGSYPTEVAQPINLQSFVIVRVSDAREGVDTLWMSSQPHSANVHQEGQPVELLPMPMWAACGTDKIVVYDPKLKQVQWIGPSGVVGSPLTVEMEEVKITDDELRANVTMRVRRLFLQQHIKEPASFGMMVDGALKESVASKLMPSSYSGPAGLLCDGAGRAWLNEFDLAESPLGNSTRWVVYGQDGSKTKAVTPRGFRLLALQGLLGYGAMRDSTTAERPAIASLEEKAK